MKRFLPLVVLIALLLPLFSTSAGAGAATASVAVYDYAADRYAAPQSLRTVNLLLDGSPLSGEMPCVLLNGRTMVPLRLLSEKLGAEITWSGSAAQVTVRRGSDTVILKLGSPTAYVNGAARAMPDSVPATMMAYGGNGYTMVPLRFFAETFGCGVTWSADTYTASVTLPGTLTAPKSPERFLIALDAGHGGTASGAYYENTAEKDLTLAMTKKLQAVLASLGYRTLLIRTGDESVGLQERANTANRAKADIFVSIHCNASETNSAAQGLHVYYYPGSTTGEALAQAIQTPACRFTGAVDRGVLSENFAVVRETHMPAVLVETGFMTCSQELARLKDDGYQQKMALGIAQGIIEYLNHQL